MTDKSKRPLKKRHASLHQHQPTNRVNKFLAQAIEARSMGQEKSNHVHALTLCFRDSLKLGTSKSIDPSSWFYYFIIFNVDNFCWNCFCRRRTVPTGCGQKFRQFSSFWAASSWPFCLERSRSRPLSELTTSPWCHDETTQSPITRISWLPCMAELLRLWHLSISRSGSKIISNKWAILWFNSDQLVGATAAEYGSRDYAARSSSSEISSTFWRNYSPTFDSSSSTQFLVQEVMPSWWVPLTKSGNK